MTCATCGRENPAHLTFCQECGQRLGPRIAPPTPPIGLGGQDAYAPPPALAPEPKPAQRAPTAAMDARPAGGDRRCKICDTVNGPNLRYCTSCGSTLDPLPAPLASSLAPTATAPPIAMPAASPPTDRAVPAIAPMRVVDLGNAGATSPEGARICARCRGTADTSAQFCKFCGASLEQPAARANGADGANVSRASFPAERAEAAPIAQVVQQAMHSMRSQPPSPSPSPIGGALDGSVYGPPPAPAPALRPSSGASGQRGRLVVIAKSGADGPSYPFGDVIDIGRTEGHVIVGEDPYLSPRHVRILWNGGKLTLRDLASTNGVFLRLAPSRDTSPRRSSDSPEVAVPLVDQDVVLVGQQVLRFDILKEGEGGLGPAQEHGTLLFGSPAAPRYARLCQRTVEGIARDIYYVRKVETVLGRESGDVVFTEDPFLSRRHAAIRLLSRDGSPGAPAAGTEARFALVDLGSSNGTFLRLRGDVELAPGDHFRVGQQLFRVDFDGARS